MTRAADTSGEPPSQHPSAAVAEPLVSVIVPNLDGRRWLERCLPALMRTEGIDFEVLLADNGSSDDSLAWTARAFPSVRRLPLERNLGFGAANRHAAAVARGRFLAFLNNDTEVDPGWLRALLRPLIEDPTVGATCAVLRLLDRSDLLNARGGAMTRLGFGFDRDFGVAVAARDERPDTEEVLFPTAAAAAMRRDDFLASGFDPAFFMYHEDVDLGWRLWLEGRRVLLCRDAVVAHAFGGTTGRARHLRMRERLGSRHNVRSLLKHYELATLGWALRKLVGVWLRHGRVGHLLAVLSWNLLHLPGTLAARARIQRSRTISDRELLERGLIAEPLVPPPSPDLPVPPPGVLRPELLPTNLLLPGQHSSLGRLGPGWFRRERDGSWMRWTCGDAACVLRVQPGATGTLAVSYRLPASAGQSRALAVECNGERAEARPQGDGWELAELRVRADANGALAVALRSPTWVPHHSRANWDYRALGCGVREIVFSPDRPVAGPRSTSVSVVIPTFNRWAVLAETLAALAGQSYRQFEVIVVDDGSTDGTWERLQHWRRQHLGALELIILHQENLKPGRARNLGLRQASGDLVVFLGDDTIPEPDFIAEHVARHARSEEPIAVLGLTDWDRTRMRVTPFLEFVNRDGPQFAYGLFEDGDDLPYTCFYTSNISLRRDVLGEEPFHPAFSVVGWEDTDLGYRLSLRGLRIILHTRARTRHVHPLTLRQFYRRQLFVGRTIELLVGLHPELADSDAMPPLEPRPWFYPARPLVPVALPFLAAADRLGLRLPDRVYRALLLHAFFTGRRRGWTARKATA